MRRILLLPLVLATMAGFGGLANAAPALANSCSNLTIGSMTFNTSGVAANKSTATCVSRWSVKDWYEYEDGGTWHHTPSSFRVGVTSLDFNCPYIYGNAVSDRWCYGTAGVSGSIPGYFGSGNTKSWENVYAVGSMSGIGSRGAYVCDYNWRHVFQIYDWTSGSQIGVTHSDEILATNC